MAPNLGRLTENHQRLVAVLDMKPVETFIQTHSSGRGRPLADRRILARPSSPRRFGTCRPRGRCSTVARMTPNCGGFAVGSVSVPFQVSRPFHGPLLGLPKRLHKAMIASAFAEVVVGHISLD